MEYTTDVFSKFDKQWALLTAGKEDDFNTMTISWGNMGTLWERPVMTVYVRTSRYTHDFMDREDYFTVSFSRNPAATSLRSSALNPAET